MESKWIDINGPVHYLEAPARGEGPPFVLVHGLGGSHANWLALGPRLAERGRVLAVDLAGFGRTPLEGRSAAVMENRALLDRFIRETVGGPVVLVGNSMGGLLSILEAHASPELVAGLVLIGPAVPRRLRGPVDKTVAAVFAAYMVPAVGEAFMNRRLRTWGPERIAQETLRICTVDPSRVSQEQLDAALALARERAKMPWVTQAFLQAARSLVRLLARRERFYRIVREVSAPTLMIMGRADRLVPIGAADDVAALRPDWDYVVFDDLGHIPQMEDPERTLDAITAWMDGPAARLLRAAGA